jgi:hypothetical protein
MVEVNGRRVPLKAPARAGGSQGANADTNAKGKNYYIDNSTSLALG